LQGQLADGAARLKLLVCLAQVACSDRTQSLAEGGPQLPGVDQAGRTGQDAVLLDHVRGAEAGAGKHEFPVDADAFGLVGIADAQLSARFHDQPDVALRSQQFAQLLPVQVGIGKVERRVDLADAQGLQLRVFLLQKNFEYNL